MSESHSHIVVRTAVGSVSYCSHCGKIHVRYGPALLRLNAKRFEQLRQFVAKSIQTHFEQDTRPDELQMRFSDISLCFSQTEAQAFLELLEEAWLTIHRSRLEKMFQL